MRNIFVLSLLSFLTPTAWAVTDAEFQSLKKIVAVQQAELSKLKERPVVCRGNSKDSIQWKKYNDTNAKYASATIDTSSCKFTKVPTYFVSGRTVAESGTWELGGYTGIYNPTPTSFTVFVWNGYSEQSLAYDLVMSTKYYFEWIGVE